MAEYTSHKKLHSRIRKVYTFGWKTCRSLLTNYSKNVYRIS